MKKYLSILSIILCAFPFIYAENNVLSSQEKSEGWSLLFNGKDMSSWRNFKSSSLNSKWIVEDGAMIMTMKGGGHIVTKEKYEDFELKLDWKISEAGNSGIFIRCSEDGKQIWSKALEMQVLDDERHENKSEANKRAGCIYDLIAAPTHLVKPAGQWNSVRIIAQGTKMEFYLNGGLTAKIDVSSKEYKELIANSKFKKYSGYGQNKEGHIGLQDHNDRVSYRNIKIRRL